MRYTKLMFQSLMIVTVVLSTLIFVSYAQQEQQESAIVGETVKLETFRGLATLREKESGKMLNASIVLTGEISEINRTRIIIKIIDGDIQIGENAYLVESGLARCILRKFGWMAIMGNATAYDGSTFRFHLEGMLHMERPRLLIAGLTGNFSNEESHYVLRLMTRIQRIE